ncbi:MAG: PHB depolymerase family esterase [Burkholderiaceae bacterium]|nr:PHB depolymerase family esterase [Burkholderiaceae bacterium]
MNNVLQNLMRQATRLTQAGRLNEATAAIQRALSGKTNTYGAVADEETHAKPAPSALILDGCVFEVAGVDTVAGAGAFTSGTHTHAMLTRRYKLYTPPGNTGRQLPLVVMLHGCTQSPDDFAVGTGMNERAREQDFCVLYPEQSQDANPQRCWNWFKHNHQRRGSGEPALIASMTQAIMKEHDIDPHRVYIAGLSAGGAMAAIVADAYPDIFAAVGVHSGLPNGAASNVAEALAVMSSGHVGNGRQGSASHTGAHGQLPTQLPQRSVPTIVFHGDQDRTVHPRNGEQVITSVIGRAAAARPRVEQGVSPNGRRYTNSTHHGDTGKVLAEHWLVHGAGHAWSGGHAKGSYTDAKGPDATAEMLRFFFAHPHTT